VPDELQEEDEDQNIFYGVRWEVLIGDIEADYDEDDGGNEEAAKKGLNDFDFDDSVMMAYCHALQQQMQLEYRKNPEKKAVHRFIVKELSTKELHHPASPSGPLLLLKTEPKVPRDWILS
jgi:hypothetical protein